MSTFSRRHFLQNAARFGAAAGLVGLAACGGAAEQSAEQDGAEIPSGEGLALAYWFYVGGPNQANMESLTADYNEQGDGVQVAAQHIPGNYLEQLLEAIASNTQPDSMWVAYWDVGVLAPGGAIIELDSYVDGSLAFSDSVEDFYPFLWETSKWQDTLYAIPFDTNNLVWFYNQELLEAAGVAAPTESPSWAQLNDLLVALSLDSDGDGAFDQWGYQINSIPRVFDDFLQQAGGAALNDEATQVIFNSEPGVEVMNLYLNWAYEMQTSPTPPIAGGFENGQVALEMQGSYRIPVYRESAEFTVGAFPASHQMTRFSGNGGESLVIFKSDAARQEAAWQFVEWMTRPETLLKWDMASGYLPVRQSVAASEEYQMLLREEPIRQVFVDELPYGGRWPIHPQLLQIQNRLRQMIETVVAERLEPRQALDAAAAELNALLATEM
ncbi:MAG: ABC transporter substrate-binding protein [Caldilineaceae bacterium]|nr:ABC transporter substrate-binding protein [Caldilineaceae bacterium]